MVGAHFSKLCDEGRSGLALTVPHRWWSVGISECTKRTNLYVLVQGDVVLCEFHHIAIWWDQESLPWQSQKYSYFCMLHYSMLQGSFILYTVETPFGELYCTIMRQQRYVMTVVSSYEKNDSRSNRLNYGMFQGDFVLWDLEMCFGDMWFTICSATLEQLYYWHYCKSILVGEIDYIMVCFKVRLYCFTLKNILGPCDL